MRFEKSTIVKSQQKSKNLKHKYNIGLDLIAFNNVIFSHKTVPIGTLYCFSLSNALVLLVLCFLARQYLQAVSMYIYLDDFGHILLI